MSTVRARVRVRVRVGARVSMRVRVRVRLGWAHRAELRRAVEGEDEVA